MSENKYKRASDFVLIEKNAIQGRGNENLGEARTELDPKSNSIINSKVLEQQNSGLSDLRRSVDSLEGSSGAKL